MKVKEICKNTGDSFYIHGDGNTKTVIEIFDSKKSTGENGFSGCSWIEKIVIEVYEYMKLKKKYVIRSNNDIDGIEFKNLRKFRTVFCNKHRATMIDFYQSIAITRHQCIEIKGLEEGL